jgi:hypothetical protein
VLNPTHIATKVWSFTGTANNRTQLIGKLSSILDSTRTEPYTQTLDKSVYPELSVESLFCNGHLPLIRSGYIYDPSS